MTINCDANIEEAARFMAKRKIRKSLVVENNTLVGIVTHTDLIGALPKLLIYSRIYYDLGDMAYNSGWLCSLLKKF